MDRKKWTHLVKYVVDTNRHWAHGARQTERERERERCCVHWSTTTRLERERQRKRERKTERERERHCTLITSFTYTQTAVFTSVVHTIITTRLSDSAKTACSESNRNESPLVFANCDNLHITSRHCYITSSHWPSVNFDMLHSRLSFDQNSCTTKLSWKNKSSVLMHEVTLRCCKFIEMKQIQLPNDIRDKAASLWVRFVYEDHWHSAC